MAVTLYRKYRPQSFKDVIGQNHIKTTIQSELESGKVAHAYLFSGPRGLGKTTTARLLAKAVNCLNRKTGESEPCNDCDSCREIVENHSLDVIEVDAASHTGVDNVRENIINNSRFTPTSRHYKVFIIDEVHMLSLSAFNALLKTLEEPPAHAIFILATTEIHKVPETIISRCQHFDFRKVSESEIVSRLTQLVSQEGKIVDKVILENIAYHAAGGIRDAESLLGQILSLDGKEITFEQAELVMPRSRFDLNLELIEYLNKKDAAAAIGLVNRLVEEGVDVEKFTADLIEVLRKIMLLKVSSDLSQYATGLSKDLEKRALNVSSQIPIDQLVKIIEAMIAVKQELKYADVAQLPLELALIALIGQDCKPTPKTIIEDNDDNDGDVGLAVEKKAEIREQKTESGKQKVEIREQKSEEPAVELKKSAGKVKLSIDQVKEKWVEVMVSLKQYNASLASTLKISRPVQVDSQGYLEICLPHKFHEQRINDSKNKQLLEKILEEIFGAKLLIRTAVAELSPESEAALVQLKAAKPDDGLSGLLSAFGGQVVD